MQHKNFGHPKMSLAQLYLDVAGVMIVTIDREGTVTEINKKGSEILGYPKEEIIGQNWFDKFVPVGIRHQLKSLFESLLEGTMQLENYENAVITRGGSERVISWHNILLRDEKGSIIGTLSSGEDITKRKQIEDEINRYRERLELVVAERTAQLAQSNETLAREIEERRRAEEGLLLRAIILEETTQPIFLVDMTGKLLYLNEAAIEMYGFPRREFIAMNFRQLNYEEAFSFENYIKNLMNQNEVEIETVHRCKNGSTIPVAVRSALISTPTGKFIVAITRDITRRINAEKSARENRAALDLALAHLPFFYWTADSELKITSAKGVGLAALGLTADEVKTMSITEIFQTESPYDPMLLAHRQALSGEAQSFTFKNRKQGRSYYAYVEPLHDEKGEIIGLTGVALETTDFKS